MATGTTRSVYPSEVQMQGMKIYCEYISSVMILINNKINCNSDRSRYATTGN